MTNYGVVIYENINNNEEVVCSNNLVITEEMLTTSFYYLNNCYPKSWEQDHDYISRFYYPKDYSKCLIYNGEQLIFSGQLKNTGNEFKSQRTTLQFTSIRF